MKNLNLKKNQVIIFVIALMLVTAGYLNFTNEQSLSEDLIQTSSVAENEEIEEIASIGDATLVSTNETSENIVSNSDDNYFTQSKLDRDNMYSQTLENYQKILETDNVTSEEKTLAQEEIKKINNEKNAIMIAENLIKTKGFDDVILFVNNGNVSVIVNTDNLDENQVAQIQNIVTRELDVTAAKINISVK